MKRILDWIPRFPEGGGLLSARKALEDSLPRGYADRRVESRLPVGEKGLARSTTAGSLLNISRSGFALQVPARCEFARGETHRLRFSVGADAVDVDGLVCWTDSVVRRQPAADRSEYSQIAGFEIPGSVSHDTQTILRIMRTMIRDMAVRVEVNGSMVVKACSANDSAAIDRQSEQV